MLAGKGIACAVVACAVTVTPVTSASARHYHYGVIGVLGAAIVGAAAAVATAPFRALGAVTAPLAAPGYYAPPRAYYGPGPYYAPPPAYYVPPPPAYYGPPPGYYAPPAYGPPAYGPPPGYYGR